MDIYIPFTYIIGWSKYKKFYYGAKYAKNCQPSDLWRTYFTSSEYVEKFRQEFGEPDIIRIHKTFKDANECVFYETEYLSKINAKDHPLFLNESNGWNVNFSEVATNENLNRVRKGIHPFQTRPDGTSLAKDRVNAGSHHFLRRPDGTSISSDNAKKSVKSGTHCWLRRVDGTSIASDRVKEGTHNFLRRPDGTSIGGDTTIKRTVEGNNPFSTRKDGTSIASDKVKDGTHNFLTRPDGTNLQTDKVKNGIHHFLTRIDGTNLQTDRVEAGTHNFLKNKGLVSCYDKDGNFIRISKELYYSQKGSKETWDYVHNKSKEAKGRKK